MRKTIISAISLLAALLAEAVTAGLDDPYEMIVRTSCHLAGDICDPSLAAPLEKTIEEHPDMVRVSGIAAGNALDVINGKKYTETEERLCDRDLPDRKRRSALRSFRNSNTAGAVPGLISIVTDATESESLRRDACEALGWYSLSVERERITAALEMMLEEDASVPERVRKEAVKTVRRLEDK